jgi:hypothetical protein
MLLRKSLPSDIHETLAVMIPQNQVSNTKKMKKYLYPFIFFFTYLSLTSYMVKPKPHLSVGTWKLFENQTDQFLFLVYIDLIRSY